MSGDRLGGIRHDLPPERDVPPESRGSVALGFALLCSLFTIAVALLVVAVLLYLTFHPRPWEP